MPHTRIPSGLDNPFWSSLATHHASIAEGGPLARRYPADFSSIAGLPALESANVDALEALVGVGEDMSTAGPFVPKLRKNWQVLHESRLTQMIRVDRTPLSEEEVDVSILGATDVPDMLALVQLAKPGPFRVRTIELGTYIGVRDAGRLVAMAGERMRIGEFREISALCTHPDARRRGYGRALASRIVNRMLRAAETPFLHVESTNQPAIDLYLALGFSRRAEYPLLHAQRIG